MRKLFSILLFTSIVALACSCKKSSHQSPLSNVSKMNGTWLFHGTYHSKEWQPSLAVYSDTTYTITNKEMTINKFADSAILVEFGAVNAISNPTYAVFICLTADEQFLVFQEQNSKISSYLTDYRRLTYDIAANKMIFEYHFDNGILIGDIKLYAP